MKRMSAFLIGLLFLVTAGSASASTMDFTSGGKNDTLIEFNNVDGTGIDIGVTASWNGLNNSNIATVTWAKNTGLGVQVNNEKNGTIDGKDYNDFLFFTFSQDVTLTDVGFGAATNNDEFDLFVDKTRVLNNEETTTYIFPLDGFIGTEFAFRATEDNDNFRVASLSFEITEPGSGANPTPEPTTMVLFGFGLLSVAGISRRKRQA